jgi:hypothetical protein
LKDWQIWLLEVAAKKLIPQRRRAESTSLATKMSASAACAPVAADTVLENQFDCALAWPTAIPSRNKAVSGTDGKNIPAAKRQLVNRRFTWSIESTPARAE